MANISELNQYGKNITGFKVQRSRFPLDNESVLTLKAGDIVPVWKCDVMPGDTIQTGFTFVMRMLTPVNPTMDNAFIDFYAFYVPNRLLCEKYHLTTTDSDWVKTPNEYGNWKTFFTENENGAWSEEETTYLKLIKPEIVAPQSVLDYLGYPLTTPEGTRLDGIQKQIGPQGDLPPINGLYVAALDLIYNDWFRNENLEAPTQERQNGEITQDTDDDTTIHTATNGGYFNDIYGLQSNVSFSSEHKTVSDYPYRATKYADLFTNSLPEPQKLNTEIVLGLAGEAPVDITGSAELGTTYVKADGQTYIDEQYHVETQGGTDQRAYIADNEAKTVHALYTDATATDINISGIADLSQATAITINQLREAITIQHIAEAFARGGTRYSEILHAIYGTAPDDITLERPELLGAKRFPVNTTQVVNSAISETGDLGELGAYSHTIGNDQFIISKSFKEHGVVMIVAVVRTSNKYYQGIEKQLSKNRLFDFYFPQFAGLGEQAVLNKEIYISGDEKTDNEVFGYQESFYEEHYKKDELHGLVNPVSGDATLASYTYQIPFDTTPTLCKDFDTQDAASIGNVLYDTKTISQFLMDIYFKTTATREMPVHAIPGVNRI